MAGRSENGSAHGKSVQVPAAVNANMIRTSTVAAATAPRLMSKATSPAVDEVDVAPASILQSKKRQNVCMDVEHAEKKRTKKPEGASQHELGQEQTSPEAAEASNPRIDDGTVATSRVVDQLTGRDLSIPVLHEDVRNRLLRSCARRGSTRSESWVSKHRLDQKRSTSEGNEIDYGELQEILGAEPLNDQELALLDENENALQHWIADAWMHELDVSDEQDAALGNMNPQE